MNLSAPELSMVQNYPNPFTESTTFKYRVAQNANVNLTVYDMNGKRIATVIDGKSAAGTYEVVWKPENVKPGTYIASLSANGKRVQGLRIMIK
jgi:pectate lyase